MASASVVAFEILARDRASGVIAKAGNNVTKTTGKMRSQAMRAAGGFAALAGVGGILSVVKSSVGLEAAFSKTMNVMQATSGASGRQMTKLRALAMKMGADTVFSAKDAADAMLELSRGGIKPAQIAAGALKGTLTLAAAGELSMGEAANIAVKSMGQFGLKGRDMGKVAAALAGGANASSASVRDMSMALAQGGLAANSVGFSIQETTAILAAFSNKGLEGSDAGTSLKTMLDRLVPSTKSARNALKDLGVITKDGTNRFLKANGEYKSAAKIAEVLHKGTQKLNASERKYLITKAFGSDAQRAATVLARVGAKGIRDMTKATSDQSAAQKMANANMKGTAGALEQFKGSLETAKLRLGQFLAPYVQKGLGLLTKGLNDLPAAMKKVTPVLKDLVDDVKAFGPVLDTAVGLVRIAYKAFDALPGPVKTVGIELGLAALILPKINAGFAALGAKASVAGAGVVSFGQRLQQNRAAMSYQTTLLGKAREGLVGFGGAARSIAGVGGILALTKSAQSSNSALKTLGSVGGGALLGFSAGGPIGAAIGAGVGLLTSLKGASHRAAVGADELAGSLNRQTGAITRNTREMVANALEKSGALKQAAALGIPLATVTKAALGNAAALKDLSARWGQADKAAKGYTLSQGAEFQAADKTRQGIAKLIQTVTGQNKEVTEATAKHRRLQEALGRTSKGARSLTNVLGLVRNAKGVPSRWIADLKRGTGDGKRAAQRGAADVSRNLRDGTGKAKANLGPFQNSLQGGITSARKTASSGGAGIGSALGAGVKSGLHDWVGPVIGEAVGMINAAIAAARSKKGADSHSPSRKMIKLGREMGQGLEVGMARSNRGLTAAGVNMLADLVKGIRKGKVPLKRALAAVNAEVRSMGSKIQGLRSQRSDLAGQFSSNFGSSVFGNEELTSVGSILGAQSSAASQAAALRSQVQGLVKAGLSKSLIQQMVNGGSAGAAQIAALSSASPDQIAQLNALNKSTERDLAGAGMSAAGAIYNQRISDAQRDQNLARTLARELARHEGGKKVEVHVHLEGKDIVYSIDKYKRKTGKK